MRQRGRIVKNLKTSFQHQKCIEITQKNVKCKICVLFGTLKKNYHCAKFGCFTNGSWDEKKKWREKWALLLVYWLPIWNVYVDLRALSHNYKCVRFERASQTTILVTYIQCNMYKRSKRCAVSVSGFVVKEKKIKKTNKQTEAHNIVKEEDDEMWSND